METETAILNLQAEVAMAIQEQTNALIDSQLLAFTQITDFMSEYISTISSIGEGISSEWSSVFSSMTAGIEAVGEALKNGQKDWTKYGNVAVSALNVASSVMMALADEQDESTKEGFEAQKKFQIAAVTMNMLSGIMGAVTSAMSPENAWMTLIGQGIMAGVLSSMIAGLGIAQIVKIQQTQFGGSSSSTSSVTPNVSAIQNVQAPVQWSSTVQGASAEEQITDTRVYVVESDITDVTQKVNVAENESRY